MNYRIIQDGFYSSIEKTNQEVDQSNEVFSSLSEAKKELIRQHKQKIDDYKGAIKLIRSITNKEL